MACRIEAAARPDGRDRMRLTYFALMPKDQRINIDDL
jgi:hypothetical protein